MSWDILREEIAIYQAKKKAAEEVVSLVKLHPEWTKQEPKLKEVLQRFDSAA